MDGPPCLRVTVMWPVFLCIKVYMEEYDDETTIDNSILNLFQFLHVLSVLPNYDYDVYGLAWGQRQRYIYRMLSHAATSD